jgi:hypothetical protein
MWALAASAYGASPVRAGRLGTGGRLPTIGSDITSGELRDAPGAFRHRGGWAAPLSAARPGWYTSAYASRVRAARGRPIAAPAAAVQPVSDGIRPGSWEVLPFGCTLNFVFRRGDAYAIGTAGHCVGDPGTHVSVLTLEPGSLLPVTVDIGRVILRRRVPRRLAPDFGLVRIRRSLRDWVDPSIAVIGGPCGAFTGDGTQTILHYGHGTVVGSGGTPRVGVSTLWRRFFYEWAGLGAAGDSGSPVRIDDRRAAGNLTHAVGVNPLPSPLLGGTRIAKIRQIAQPWRLVMEPSCG